MKSYKTLLFIVASVALLTLTVCLFPADGLNVFGVNLRMPTLEKIMAPQGRAANGGLASASDSQQMAEQKDSTEFYRSRLLNGGNRFWFPEDNIDFFNPLMERMQEARRLGEVVRIVHYGDSQIEMDRMTSQLRSYAQKTFGGGGPGMIPLQTVINTPVVSLKTTGKLQYKAPYGNKKNSSSANGQYGPLVHSHVLNNGEATTTIKASNAKSVDDAAKEFDRLSLIYGNPEEQDGKLQCRVSPIDATCTDSVQKSMSANHPVQTMRWNFSQPVSEATIEMKGNATLFGIMADKGPGVAVDNVPMRGCSGQQFGLINAQELECAYKKMNVGMIILQFGGNAVPTISGERSLAAYAKTVGEQIDYLHHCCPDALILFVGPGDMCKSVRGEKVTYPLLPAIVEGLRDTVTAHGAAFWSLFDAMGGSGSMAEWVPQHLAGKDHIHFTQQGANLMGDRLAEALDNAYRYFLLRKKAEQNPLLAENKSAKR